MRSFVVLFLGFGLLVGCGKNDPYRSTGYPPYGPNGTIGNGYNPYAPGVGGYPNSNIYTGGLPNGFPGNGQLPSGYSGGFSPFMPSYQYMQQSPQWQNYWQNQVWNPWVNQGANQYGCGVYNFNCFWQNYCRPRFQYYPWYQQMNGYYLSIGFF